MLVRKYSYFERCKRVWSLRLFPQIVLVWATSYLLHVALSKFSSYKIRADKKNNARFIKLTASKKHQDKIERIRIMKRGKWWGQKWQRDQQMKRTARGKKKGEKTEGENQNIFPLRWQCTSKLNREMEGGWDFTFHLATVATLDACGNLPLCVPFDASLLVQWCETFKCKYDG